MATSSKLKTADGKYYATEDYVKSYVDENTLTQDEISGTVSGIISNEISGKADLNDVYTKEEVSEIISGLFSMNTIE